MKLWAENYFRCNDCLFISSVPAPTEGELDQHYANYHDSNHQASQKKNEQRAQSYLQEIQWLGSKVPLATMTRAFDYGASGGYFLDALSQVVGRDCQLLGHDASPPALEVLRSKDYLRAMEELEAHSVDLLILRGVLEHLLDFRSVVGQLCSTLRTGGHLFISATPDSSCTVANSYRADWVQHHYPSHFQHFNTNLVDLLMAENGLVPHANIDLYEHSVYRAEDDDSHWLENRSSGSGGSTHAYWGSMMTRLYRKP